MAKRLGLGAAALGLCIRVFGAGALAASRRLCRRRSLACERCTFPTGHPSSPKISCTRRRRNGQAVREPGAQAGLAPHAHALHRARAQVVPSRPRQPSAASPAACTSLTFGLRPAAVQTKRGTLCRSKTRQTAEPEGAAGRLPGGRAAKTVLHRPSIRGAAPQDPGGGRRHRARTPRQRGEVAATAPTRAESVTRRVRRLSYLPLELYLTRLFQRDPLRCQPTRAPRSVREPGVLLRREPVPRAAFRTPHHVEHCRARGRGRWHRVRPVTGRGELQAGGEGTRDLEEHARDGHGRQHGAEALAHERRAFWAEDLVGRSGLCEVVAGGYQADILTRSRDDGHHS